MEQQSLTQQVGDVVKSYHDAYLRMANEIKDIKKNVIDPDKTKDKFVLAVSEGITLGVSMSPLDDGRHLLMLGYVDETLRQMTDGMSVERHHHLLTLFGSLNNKPDLIHKAFIVSDMDDEYYSHYPLVSIETYIPSDLEITHEMVEATMHLLNKLINLVKNKSIS